MTHTTSQSALQVKQDYASIILDGLTHQTACGAGKPKTGKMSRLFQATAQQLLQSQGDQDLRPQLRQHRCPQAPPCIIAKQTSELPATHPPAMP